MGFNSIKSLVDSMDAGKVQVSSFRKVFTQSSTAGYWVDFSMGTGNPNTNYYASTPLESARLVSNNGIYAGQNATPDAKFLKSIMVMGTSSMAPINLMLCDYLLYYPFIDGDSLDEQIFDNTLSLPRYTDGLGVKAFIVAQGSYIGNARFVMNYTNELGVSGRTSIFSRAGLSPTPSAGTIVSSGLAAGMTGPFIPLQVGDKGIRSVQSFTWETSNGGIFALVLCVPIATTSIREINAAVEKDFVLDTGLACPRIQDGAYLNFIGLPFGNIQSQQIIGTVEIVTG
jgi:hypothetical protein